MDGKLKGIALFSLAIGVIVLVVGVALLYLVPELVVEELNNTDVFDPADVVTALDRIDDIRNIAFVVIILAVIWMLISVMRGGKG